MSWSEFQQLEMEDQIFHIAVFEANGMIEGILAENSRRKADGWNEIGGYSGIGTRSRQRAAQMAEMYG